MLKEFKEIVPGTSLGKYKITPTTTQLFMFSAITWNRHQIHFNRDQAVLEGFPDVAVQRGLIGNFLVQYIANSILPPGNLRCLKWKVINSAFPGRELQCLGEVISVCDKEIRCALRIVNETGTPIAEGEANYSTKEAKND